MVGMTEQLGETAADWCAPALNTTGWEPCEVPEWNYSEGRPDSQNANLWVANDLPQRLREKN